MTFYWPRKLRPLAFSFQTNKKVCSLFYSFFGLFYKFCWVINRLLVLKQMFLWLLTTSFEMQFGKCCCIWTLKSSNFFRAKMLEKCILLYFTFIYTKVEWHLFLNCCSLMALDCCCNFWTATGTSQDFFFFKRLIGFWSWNTSWQT